MQEDITLYIAQCAKEGLVSPNEITSKAQQEILDIQKTLSEQEKIAAKLFPRKALLLQVLKTFGVLPSKQQKTIVPFISDITPQEELTELQKEMLQKCYSFLEEVYAKNEQVVARDIMNALQLKIEDDVIVYSLIKWMGIQGFIKRNNGFIIPGDNWDKRY